MKSKNASNVAKVVLASFLMGYCLELDLKRKGQCQSCDLVVTN